MILAYDIHIYMQCYLNWLLVKAYGIIENKKMQGISIGFSYCVRQGNYIKYNYIKDIISCLFKNYVKLSCKELLLKNCTHLKLKFFKLLH